MLRKSSVNKKSESDIPNGYIIFRDDEGKDQRFVVKDWSKWMKLYRIVRSELDD